MTGDIITIAGNSNIPHAFTAPGKVAGDGGPVQAAPLNHPIGLAVGSQGNIFVGDDEGVFIREFGILHTVMLPTTPVASTSGTQNVFVELTAASTLSSTQRATVPNGSQNNFIVGAVTGCAADGTTIYPIGTICTIPVSFNPQYPGVRTGALTLYSSGTTVLGTVGLTGIGTGPFGASVLGPTGVRSAEHRYARWKGAGAPLWGSRRCDGKYLHCRRDQRGHC